jgi:hypothetical protein
VVEDQLVVAARLVQGQAAAREHAQAFARGELQPLALGLEHGATHLRARVLEGEVQMPGAGRVTLPSSPSTQHQRERAFQQVAGQGVELAGGEDVIVSAVHARIGYATPTLVAPGPGQRSPLRLRAGYDGAGARHRMARCEHYPAPEQSGSGGECSTQCALKCRHDTTRRRPQIPLLRPRAAPRTRQVVIGGVKVGGSAPVVVQSMTNTDTADVASTTKQVAELWRAGSELVRITVNNAESAAAVPRIVDKLAMMGISVPLIGDFHYNGHQLLANEPACAEALAKYRINPGNVGFGKKRDTQFAQLIEFAIRTASRCASAPTGVRWTSRWRRS